jgi:hypothetical protein
MCLRALGIEGRDRVIEYLHCYFYLSFTVLYSVESMQSHFILTMSHWSSGLPVCFPSQGTQVQIPWGVLM